MADSPIGDQSLFFQINWHSFDGAWRSFIPYRGNLSSRNFLSFDLYALRAICLVIKLNY